MFERRKINSPGFDPKNIKYIINMTMSFDTIFWIIATDAWTKSSQPKNKAATIIKNA